MLNLQTDIETVLPQRPKNTLLPILTVLFLVSYGLMVMLIMEQGRTIDTQRYLIRSLFNDSSQLSAMKNSALQKNAQTQARARAQAPMTQAGPQQRGRNNATRVRPLPQKPPKDTSDSADERRSLLTI